MLQVWLAWVGCLINGALYEQRLDELRTPGSSEGIEIPITDGDGDGWSTQVDCDDGVATIHPGRCEICGDGLDQNCDGADSSCPSWIDGEDTLRTAVELSGSDPFDNAGVSVASAGDFDGDGNLDLIIGASHAEDPDRVDEGTPGTAYLLLGPVLDSQPLSANYLLSGGQDDDRTGVSVTGADYDGDGFSELVIGAKLYDTGSVDDGAVYIVPGGTGELGLASELSEVGYRLDGERGEQAGFWVSSLSDVDGDSLPDLAIGAPMYNGGQGRVYLLRGPLPLSGRLSVVASGKLFGETQGRGEAGSQVEGLGDVDGDGLGEVIVAAMRAGSSTGTAYVMRGRPGLLSGSKNLADADWAFTGERFRDRAASSVGGGGDVDGDGSNDLLIGARKHSRDEPLQGAVYLLTSGTLAGLSPEKVRLSAEAADAKIYGATVFERLGQSVDIVGDVDCDGYADLLLGGDQHSDRAGEASQPGVAYLLFGPVEGERSLGDDPGVRFVGANSGDRLGNHLAGVGDIDGDDVPDFLIGAYNAAISQRDGVGQGWLVFGSGPW